jgi:hypothetical protein
VGERLLQSAGYTHLYQLGSAADLPSLGSSPVWRKVYQFQEASTNISSLRSFLLTFGAESMDIDD